VLIFILPPSWEELRSACSAAARTARGDRQRMANARLEVAQARHFDFVIINALFETALFDLKTIVHSQRLRYAAQHAQPLAGVRCARSELMPPKKGSRMARITVEDCLTRSRTASSWCWPPPTARAC
jgi:hypothetical protein